MGHFSLWKNTMPPGNRYSLMSRLGDPTGSYAPCVQYPGVPVKLRVLVRQYYSSFFKENCDMIEL